MWERGEVVTTAEGQAASSQLVWYRSKGTRVAGTPEGNTNNKWAQWRRVHNNWNKNPREWVRTRKGASCLCLVKVMAGGGGGGEMLQLHSIYCRPGTITNNGGLGCRAKRRRAGATQCRQYVRALLPRHRMKARESKWPGCVVSMVRIRIQNNECQNAVWCVCV